MYCRHNESENVPEFSFIVLPQLLSFFSIITIFNAFAFLFVAFAFAYINVHILFHMLIVFF